jgi:hypothetical protein
LCASSLFSVACIIALFAVWHWLVLAPRNHFLEPTKHCTEAQLEAAESSSGASKFESDLPGWEDPNFDVLQVDRSGRRSQCPREAHGGQETIQP